MRSGQIIANNPTKLTWFLLYSHRILKEKQHTLFNMKQIDDVLEKWPDEPRNIANQIIDEYGDPDGWSEQELESYKNK